MTQPGTVVLIPGAWARGPGAWAATRQALVQRDVEVIMPTLPKEEVAEASMARCMTEVVAQVRLHERKQTARTPRWLVTHSAGGALVPALVRGLHAAGLAVRGVVLVTAFVPLGGESVITLRPSMTDEQRTGVRAKMAAVPAAMRALPVPEGEQLEGLYLAGLPGIERERLLADELVPEPFALLNTPVDYAEIFRPLPRRGLARVLRGKARPVPWAVPVHYVFCTEDRALPYTGPAGTTSQRWLVKRLRSAGCAGEERMLTAGHNVLLTHPDELAETLLTLVGART